ncbi:MAG: Clp protease N-terminal domain-containing protein [Hyphomicrobiaceae bacterium]|nr:Clp protease N-terminal domain-containing protein [Hyphomicrobiaceae bacterium]
MVAQAQLGHVPMSPRLAKSLARAAEYARAQAHAEVALEHVLLALSEDEDATAILGAAAIDVDVLKTDVSGHLGRLEGRLPDGHPGTSAISNELKGVLQYAAKAARQSKRADIDGAIVLCAIVGLGQSNAAAILRAHGLTFEAAIQALQNQLRAAAQSGGPGGRPGSGGEIDGSRPRSPADAILADTRARIESRRNQGLGPSLGDAATAPPQRSPHDMEAGQPFDAPGSFEPSNSAPPPQVPHLPPAPGPEPVATRPAAQSWAPQPAPPPASGTGGGLARPYRIPPPLPPEGPVTPLPYGEAAAGTAVRPDPVAAPPPWAPVPGPPPGWGQTPPAGQAGPGGAVGGPNGGRFGSPVAGGGLPPLDDVLPPLQPAGAQAGRGMGPAPGPPPASPQHANAPAPYAQDAAAAARARGRRKPAGAPASGMAIETGQLVENIPRFMRVGRPSLVEVRIAKSEVTAIAAGLEGGGAAYRHDVLITKAMAVRLRAPDGGFFIETASPETQWIDNPGGMYTEDFASWRWTVTPKLSGRKRLQLIVSARTVGTDGVAAETALPDQVVEVRVRMNYARTFARWLGWILAAVIGGALARFGEQGWSAAEPIVRQLLAP